jgi:small subunit ribosomal protein S6
MSKTKSSEIPHYELLYIISNKFSEDELAPLIQKVNKIIADYSGIITHTEEWGKKRLAYPIKSFGYGYYILVEFNLIGEKLKEIDRLLRMTSEILRHQIVKKKIKSVEEIEKEKKISEKIAAKAEKEKKITKEKEKLVDKEKINLKELDEKLDKILETDDLL